MTDFARYIESAPRIQGKCSAWHPALNNLEPAGSDNPRIVAVAFLRKVPPRLRAAWEARHNASVFRMSGFNHSRPIKEQSGAARYPARLNYTGTFEAGYFQSSSFWD